MNLYWYELKYYDDINYVERMAKGVTYGENYGNAALKLVEVYGEDSIADLYIQAISDSSIPVVEIDEDGKPVVL